MKNKFYTPVKICIVLFSFFCSVFFAKAQVPQSMNYQAVARNAVGDPIANQTVALQFTIRTDSMNGTVVYRENTTKTTNQFGLFTASIGAGVPNTGTFAGINWNNGYKFLQVEMDPAGGMNFTNMGTSQLVSVPYALYAETSGDNNWLKNGTNIYNANTGNVGIGTPTPAFQLQSTQDAAFNGVQVGRGGGNESTNTAVGSEALLNNTTGGLNPGIGNTATGYRALYLNTEGMNNTANGQTALYSNTTGSFNAAFGQYSMYANTTGTANTAMGANSMSTNSSGYDNAGFGNASLYFTSTGYQNSAVGRSALIDNTTGYGNSAIGYLSGELNTTGSLNTFIGSSAKGTDALTNATAIGANAYVTADNAVVLGSVNGVNGAAASANVGIGISSPDASAALDINSTTRGFLPPRMNNGERDAIVSPATGLIIYNTTMNKPQYFDGEGWRNFDGTHYYGEMFQGGYVFYIDNTGQHGLVAAPVDQNGGAITAWWNGTNIVTGATGTGIGTGATNTATIVAAQGAGTYAASICDALVLNGYSDWFLPSKDELAAMENNLFTSGLISISPYITWSSSESSITSAWHQFLAAGGSSQGTQFKVFQYRVRAARAF